LPGVSVSSLVAIQQIVNLVNAKTFNFTDMYSNVILTNCYLPIYPIYYWTSYGPCPTQPCQNGGQCNCNPTGQFYCQCPAGYTGNLCQSQATAASSSFNSNLLWLLVIPALLLLLLLTICLLCLCRWCCQPPQTTVIDEDVYEDGGDAISVRSTGSVRSCAPTVYTLNRGCDPNTYFHSTGRPFAVAYNDNSFNAIGYTAGDPVIYGGSGRSCGGDVLVVNGGGSVCDGGSTYTTQLGNKFAVAFNDSSFNTYSTAPRGDRVVYYN